MKKLLFFLLTITQYSHAQSIFTCTTTDKIGDTEKYLSISLVPNAFVYDDSSDFTLGISLVGKAFDPFDPFDHPYNTEGFPDSDDFATDFYGVSLETYSLKVNNDGLSFSANNLRGSVSIDSDAYSPETTVQEVISGYITIKATQKNNTDPFSSGFSQYSGTMNLRLRYNNVEGNTHFEVKNLSLNCSLLED